MRCIKKQLEGTEVHYLTKRVFLPLLENNPYIDKIHTIDNDVHEAKHALIAEKFDCVIDLHNNLRTLMVKRYLKTRSYSFKKLTFEKLLKVRLGISILPSIHIVDRYIHTAKALGVVNDGKGLDYFIQMKDEVPIETLPVSHQQGYIGFVIGAAHFTKRFPEDKIIDVCRQLTMPIVLLGGKEDMASGASIASQVGDKVVNACGKYNLNQSASLVRQSMGIITNDTGLMHIAAAFHKPIVSIWGNTIPDFGMYPYYGKDALPASKMLEVKKLSCRPCSKIGYKKCPRGHFKCMNAITTEEVVGAVNGLG